MAYEAVLKLKIEEGRSILSQIIPNQAQSGHYYYVKSLSDVLEILITEDPKLYKKYQDSEDDNLKGLKEVDENDSHKLYYAAEIKIQWALVKILFGDDFKAGLSLKSAYTDIEKNIEKFPDFLPNQKSYGSLHVLFSAVPDTHQWFMKFLGVKSNLLLGWDELSTIEKNSPFWIETQLIKSLIAVNIFNDEILSMSLLKDLLEVQKDNLLANYLYNTALIKYAQSEKALPKFQRLLFVGDDYTFVDFTPYRLGEIYIQKQNYGLARYYYSRFLNQYRGANFVKDSWYKIFLTYWLEGDEKMAEIHWSKATKAGTTFVDADKNANGILEGDNYPHKELVKARLAIDGGYFDLAQKALNNIQQGGLTSKKEESEYFYRYGRMYDKQNKDEEAIFYYLNAIKKIGKGNWYFGAAACLYTGYIYESRLELEKAEFYYSKARSYKKHKYKEGIDSKANAALLFLARKQQTPDELIDN